MTKLLNLIFLLIFIMIPIIPNGYCQDLKNSTFPEKERSDFLNGCIQRGLQRGDDPDYVRNFCNCSWEVQSTHMTYEEYIEMIHMAKEGKNPAEIPQLRRIWDKLQGCKNK